MVKVSSQTAGISLLGIACLFLTFFACVSGTPDTQKPPSKQVPTESVTPSGQSQKDLHNFRLPETVTRVAPHMQSHLLTLIPYNSFRFQVKPEYVFAEGPNPSLEEVTRGPYNISVARLNLVHLVYYREDSPLWSGSLLKGVENNASVTSKEGFLIQLETEGDQVSLEFKDGELVFSHRFHYDTDIEAWQEAGSNRLYINYYVFPESLLKIRR